jgi:hypothetical protein
MSYFQTSAADVMIDPPQAISIVVFPRRQPWRCKVVEIDLRQILRELKIQRRQMDRAIAALEAVVDGTKKNRRKTVTAKRNQDSSPVGNGTTGEVVPFARGLKLSGS